MRAVLGQCPQDAANPASIEQRCCGARWLLFRAPKDCCAPVVIDGAQRRHPFQHGREVTQCVTAYAEFDIVGVDEVEPDAVANEDEGAAIRWSDDQSRHKDRPLLGYMSDVTRQTGSRKQVAIRRCCGCVIHWGVMTQSLLSAHLVRVCVGSTNPVKVAATKAVFARCAPSVIVEGRNVPSGVPDQPWGDEETRAGAVARAVAALQADAAAQFGVGLEGGVVRERDGSVRSCAWAAVVDAAGTVSTGGSLALTLPPAVVALLDAGVELGVAMDRVARTSGTKHGSGAVGLLTAGLIHRQAAYEPLVTYALSRWLGAALWEVDPGQR
jgi:inosine/xanthosine triphosphatase